MWFRLAFDDFVWFVYTSAYLLTLYISVISHCFCKVCRFNLFYISSLFSLLTTTSFFIKKILSNVYLQCLSMDYLQHVRKIYIKSAFLAISRTHSTNQKYSICFDVPEYHGSCWNAWLIKLCQYVLFNSEKCPILSVLFEKKKKKWSINCEFCGHKVSISHVC